MTSSRPYIIRALYEWILENSCTPYILVNAYGQGVQVPQEHVKVRSFSISRLPPCRGC
jgi:stringent starvation protein B